LARQSDRDVLIRRHHRPQQNGRAGCGIAEHKLKRDSTHASSIRAQEKRHMVSIKKEAGQAMSHARAAAGEAGRQGGRLATRLAQTTVREASKTVARVGRQATEAAGNVVGKTTR